jgi:hypothetical protein
MLLVLARRRQIRRAEVELLAIAASSPETAEQTSKAMKRYQKLLFPGVADEATEDDPMRALRAQLAEETKKAFVVTPLVGAEAKRAIADAAAKNLPGMSQLARDEMNRTSRLVADRRRGY